jgi:2'-5' RNA ligase
MGMAGFTTCPAALAQRDGGQARWHTRTRAGSRDGDPALQPSHRYNVSLMTSLLYAAIAYVRSPVGIFVEQLRRELHPAHTHADAHLTVLPPRPLHGTEQQAIDLLTEVCRTTIPFEITMGDVESFLPVTPTVFIRVAHGAYRMRELHDRMNRDVLQCKEPWPYMPHLTVVKADAAEEVPRVIEVARDRWKEYSDTRKVRIGKLTFVKGNAERWVDLAAMPLAELAVR